VVDTEPDVSEAVGQGTGGLDPFENVFEPWIFDHIMSRIDQSGFTVTW